MNNILSVSGFFGIGIYCPKHEENIGTLWRHAYLYNASFIFTIGNKYKNQCSDTIKATRHIPLYHYESWGDFKNAIPAHTNLVGVEMDEKAQFLSGFKHPKNAIYILGSESFGLPKNIVDDCDSVVKIESLRPQSMNVSTAGTLVIYDRTVKMWKETE